MALSKLNRGILKQNNDLRFTLNKSSYSIKLILISLEIIS